MPRLTLLCLSLLAAVGAWCAEVKRIPAVEAPASPLASAVQPSLAELAERSRVMTGLEAPRLVAAQAAVAPGGAIESLRLTYAGFDNALRKLANRRTVVDIAADPKGAILSSSRRTERKGLLKSRRIDALDIPEKSASAQELLNAVRNDFPDMLVTRAELGVETDGYWFGLGSRDPETYTSWDVPVWRATGRSRNTPSVEMVQTYEAKGLRRRSEWSRP